MEWWGWVPAGVQFLVGFAAALTALTVIYRKIVKPAWQKAVTAVRAWPDLARDIATLKQLADDTQDLVNRQLQPNGGSSLWDAVNRIETQGTEAARKVEEARRTLADLAVQKEAEHRELRDGQERQWQAFLWMARQLPAEDDADDILDGLDDE